MSPYISKPSTAPIKMKYIVENDIANIVNTTIKVVTLISINIANQSFLLDLIRVIATLHSKKTTPHLTPTKAYLTTS